MRAEGGSGSAAADRDFYASLSAFDGFTHVADPSVYREAPGSWFALLTDVVDSTSAIRAGRYRDVNAIGVATIVAALNAAAGEELAYLFSGDGAIVLGPASAREALARAAAQAVYLAQEAFGLSLRAGLIPVATLLDAGSHIGVAKMRLSPELSLAMFDGSGMALAEGWLRDPTEAPKYAVPAVDHYDAALFEGFECRWRPLASRHGLIVSLLVRALGEPDQRKKTYERVLQAIDGLGELAGLHPVSHENLQLAEAEHLDREAKVRTGRPAGLRRWLHATRVSVVTAIGRVLLRTKRRLADFDGASYVDQVIERTDFRKFDGLLRMVLDLTPAQESSMRRVLEEEERQHRLVYGMHCDQEAVLTCLIRDYKSRHLHFLDGGGGGYALAAVELKQKLRRSGPFASSASAR